MSFIGFELEFYVGWGFLVFLMVVVLFSIWVKVISWSGGLAGVFIVIGMYFGGGWLGVVLFGLFFVMGFMVMRWECFVKEVMGVV